MDHTVFNSGHHLFRFGIWQFGKPIAALVIFRAMFLFRRCTSYTEELWFGGTRLTKEEQDDFIEGWSGVIQHQMSGQKSGRLDNRQLEVIAKFKQYFLITAPSIYDRAHETSLEPQLSAVIYNSLFQPLSQQDLKVEDGCWVKPPPLQVFRPSCKFTLAQVLVPGGKGTKH